MELPFELRSAIENKLQHMKIKDVKKNAENISLRYRTESGKGKKLVTEEVEALAYSAVRMPATFGAVCTALKNTFEIYEELRKKSTLNNDLEIVSLLDVGAGTGAGTWAASQFSDFDNITCLEREDVMLNLGKSLMRESESNELKKVSWKKFDLVIDEIKDNADLVICSYVLNELDDINRMKALQKLWRATNKILLIIEPGTPAGFEKIKEMRKWLINNNASVLAPCPNSGKCLMPEDDWCHTTCRVSRSKIHKLLKSGEVPYEDEKFSYIAVCKYKFNSNNIVRVLRHPKIEAGKITLKVCNKDGVNINVITKKDKNLFKKVRKINCGDCYQLAIK